MGRAKIYHAIWDPELCGYVEQAYNSLDEDLVQTTLIEFFGEQDADTLEDLEALSIDELAEIANLRIERDFRPFPEDTDFLQYEELG